MEISRTYLQTMLREFWGINNELCENVTIVFLRKLDLTDKEIEEWMDFNFNDQKIKDRDLSEAEEIFDEAVQETVWYF